jgi:4-alpha-glucanotransferase
LLLLENQTLASKVSLAMLVHSHQPVGNFDHVVEEAYQLAYSPFLTVLTLRPGLRVSLHYSGILLEWLEAHHPDFFQRLRRLIEAGQVEMVGGGYYEPILPAIPDRDKVTQIRRMRNYLYEHFRVTPRGAWLAERVWEPSLARPLAEAGVEFVVLDDTHFLAAGLQPHQLHGYYMTEENGSLLRVVPSLKVLRYTMPFREPEETLDILNEGRGESNPLFAVGDDCEKFGVWPGTFEHCYTKGWLKRFLEAIEEGREWLETTTLSDFLKSNPPQGRIYLPAASYEEMMQWALPMPASAEFKACLDECEQIPNGERFRRFLLGGLWRNFLSKYPESNQIHKLMLETNRRWRDASLAAAAGSDSARRLEEARTHLLRSQCNDAYWHGAFGGLYAPHLRGALLRHLIKAEVLLDQFEGAGNAVTKVESRDWDADGEAEVLVESPVAAILARPQDGGTVSSLRYKPAGAELINSIMRRPECYHELLRREVTTHTAPKEGPASIHDRVLAKEADLDALLCYDRYGRHLFRTYVFSAPKTWQDFADLRLDERRDLAGGAWTLAPRPPAAAVQLERESHVGELQPIRAMKTICLKAEGTFCRLECRSSFSADSVMTVPWMLGVELVFNLEAPNAPDRYFLVNSDSNEVRRPLEFKGEIRSAQLQMVDEWQRVRIRLSARPNACWWIVPIQTVSQSESGFERVYQGSAILAVWRIERGVGRRLTRMIRLEISGL